MTSSSYVLENCAMLGGLQILSEPTYSGALVGYVANSNATIRACSFMGFCNWNTLAPIAGITLQGNAQTPKAELCFVQLNANRVYTGEETGCRRKKNSFGWLEC